MKRVLILTVTAGNGHNASARALKKKLESLGDIEVKVVDVLKEYSSALNFWIADGGYSKAVRLAPAIYNLFFKHYEKSKPENRYSCAAQKTSLSILKGLMKEILEFEPDVIYCAQFYGAIALTDLKLVYDLPCKSIAVCLDYENSPFWEAAIGVDHFVIPNEDFVDEFVREGFRKEQLLPIGLPVDTRSLAPIEKKKARAALGLEKDVFTVMIMFGGGCWAGGFKIFKWLVKALKGQKAQVIMVNGKDKNSFERIEKMKFDEELKVFNVGFTNSIPLYMSASDIVINKCGGLSTTEAINMSKPMVIVEKLPMQEKYNLQYLKKKGVALSFKNRRELKEEVLKLMQSPELLDIMTKNTQALRKNAVDDIAKLIRSMPRADYSKLEAECVDLTQVCKQVKKAVKQADKQEKQKLKGAKK